MKNYSFWNKTLGWIIFAIASFVYLSTIEPTASFWDCGEFISASYKLLVGHPPGAPVFMLIGRIFTMLAPGPDKVALFMNAMSGLSSSFTILFLFWTITHLAKKLVVGNDTEISLGSSIAILGAGVVGSLAYTFSDSFWFSAVEGEVYAMSSLFTAVVFWAILKWENVADEPNSSKWIILIGYLVGLSVGVHLLNLLAIPAIGLVYYFKKYKPSVLGTIVALAVSMVILLGIMYGVIPGIVKMASVVELIFVNGIGLPFHSGAIFFIILLLAAVSFGIYYTYVKGKVLGNVIITFLTVILIGYSSFAVIVIRSSANPPMDQNSPDNMFSLLSYLNREQYGDRPLAYGQYYSTPILKTNETKPVRQPIGDKYEIVDRKMEYVYDSRLEAFFPRMWSSQSSHKREYQRWGKVTGQKIRGKDGKTYVKPTFTENMRFLFQYQLGHMYWRYFMWNFSGRQNDEQGHGNYSKGNWISGIEFIDAPRIGSQKLLPDSMKNTKSRNVYFMLPLLLGLIGIAYQILKGNKGGYESLMIVGMLFILTGIAIVIYLNQYPIQPRERDYAYAGSFYAFSIWIGLGVLYLWELFRKVVPSVPSAALATVLGIGIPAIMGAENWDDHDRSNRYTTRDFAWNYLNSCEEDAVIFTNGDNDTFPLWYAQEVEGYRTDVRVCNLSYLQTDWYIDQMRRRSYESAPLPFSLNKDQTREGQRSATIVYPQLKDRRVPLDRSLEFIGSDRKETKSQEGYSFFPGGILEIPIDSAWMIETKTVAPKDADKIVKTLEVDVRDVPRGYIGKNSLMILDLLSTNNWVRPVYFAVTVPEENYVNLDKYFQVEGLAYRVVPVLDDDQAVSGRVNTDAMYENMVNKFRWGGIDEGEVYLDETIMRMCINYRNNFVRLSNELLKEGKKEKARIALKTVYDALPPENVPYNYWSTMLAEACYNAGLTEEANTIMEQLGDNSIEELRYYYSQKSKFQKGNSDEIQMKLATLQRVYEISMRKGQEELAKKYEQELMGFIGRMQQQSPAN